MPRPELIITGQIQETRTITIRIEGSPSDKLLIVPGVTGGIAGQREMQAFAQSCYDRGWEDCQSKSDTAEKSLDVLFDDSDRIAAKVTVPPKYPMTELQQALVTNAQEYRRRHGQS